MSAMMDAIKKAQMNPIKAQDSQAAKPQVSVAKSQVSQMSQDETLVDLLTKALEMAKKPAPTVGSAQIETLERQNASLAETVKETAARNKELVDSNNELEKALDNLQALTMDLTVDPKSIPEGIVKDHYEGVQDKAAALFGVIKNFNDLAKTNPALSDPQTFINVIKAIAVAPC